jgi:hypothetical protein
MREDHSQLRMGHAPHLLAILNNTVVGLMARQGRTNLAEAWWWEFAYQFDQALATLFASTGGTRLCNVPDACPA